MSNTRRAAPGSEFSAEKFASSGEFERGLLGSMVARRCTVLEDPKDKELIWFIHFLSRWGIGLKALAAELPANYPEYFGTPEMVRLGKRAGQSYSAEQVRKIRSELPEFERQQFLLRGETLADVDRNEANSRYRAREAARAVALRKTSEAYDDGLTDSDCDAITRREMAAIEREDAELKAAAETNPSSYPVSDFLAVCSQTAANELEESIRRLCLDPACDPVEFQPWYFASLVDALRDYFKEWTAERAEGLVTTAIGEEIIETLEYTAYSRKLTLIEGEARTGKTFAARTWCELHPGRARFIEVPTGNDETSFFRALARGLGIGNFAQYKAIEIRERVESVLLTGDILICLDESWRLWPQTDLRTGFPKRINWVMSMSNQGAPICLVSTKQFLATLKAVEEKTGWNTAQLQGRLVYKQLPGELSKKDLVNVAAALLPEADDETLRAIADYARSSARYLAAIETISTRARYLASRAGRDTAEAEDVRRAMRESVIPSDSKLVRVLESKPPKQRALRLAPSAAAELPEISTDEPQPNLSTRRTGTLNPEPLEAAE